MHAFKNATLNKNMRVVTCTTEVLDKTIKTLNYLELMI